MLTKELGKATGMLIHDFKLRTQTSNDFEIGHKFQNNDLNITNSFLLYDAQSRKFIMIMLIFLIKI